MKTTPKPDAENVAAIILPTVESGLGDLSSTVRFSRASSEPSTERLETCPNSLQTEVLLSRGVGSSFANVTPGTIWDGGTDRPDLRARTAKMLLSADASRGSEAEPILSVLDRGGVDRTRRESLRIGKNRLSGKVLSSQEIDAYKCIDFLGGQSVSIPAHDPIPLRLQSARRFCPMNGVAEEKTVGAEFLNMPNHTRYFFGRVVHDCKRLVQDCKQ